MWSSVEETSLVGTSNSGIFGIYPGISAARGKINPRFHPLVSVQGVREAVRDSSLRQEKVSNRQRIDQSDSNAAKDGSSWIGQECI